MYHPLEKGGTLHLNELVPPITNDALLNWSIGSLEEDEILKLLQTDRRTDRRMDVQTFGETTERKTAYQVPLCFQLS